MWRLRSIFNHILDRTRGVLTDDFSLSTKAGTGTDMLFAKSGETLKEMVSFSKVEPTLLHANALDSAIALR